MTDFKLTGGATADLQIVSGDIATDDGLDNACLLSLFLDRRANDGDVLPDGESDRRGWWGDEFLDGKIGSRLWLLDRSKTTDVNLRTAKAYAEEALAWMVSQGVAKAVSVSVEAERGHMQFTISIDRVSGGRFAARYGYNWREKEVTNGLR